jgi:hypothetical protein
MGLILNRALTLTLSLRERGLTEWIDRRTAT